MKKHLLALAVLGAFAGAASAQSSVTLFGLVDLSVNSIKNGSTTIKSMDSNQLNSNRLGFRGTEDLGGGMKAGFWLEGGMSSDVGLGGNSSGGFDFQRRSTVSLMGSFGEIRLGRDYVNTFSTVATHEAYGANGFGSGINIYNGASAKLGLGSSYNTVVRANNMVGYFTPDLGGLYGSLQVAAGERVTGNKYIGFRVGYAAGPVDVSLSTSNTDVASNVGKVKVLNFGGSYNLGFAKIMAFYDTRKFGSLKYNTIEVSTSVPLGQGEFRLAYTRGDASGNAVFEKNDANLIGGEYIYNLSKRTAAYGQFGRLSNKGASAIALGGAIGTPTSGFTSTGYGVGVRHIF